MRNWNAKEWLSTRWNYYVIRYVKRRVIQEVWVLQVSNINSKHNAIHGKYMCICCSSVIYMVHFFPFVLYSLSHYHTQKQKKNNNWFKDKNKFNWATTYLMVYVWQLFQLHTIACTNTFFFRKICSQNTFLYCT